VRGYLALPRWRRSSTLSLIAIRRSLPPSPRKDFIEHTSKGVLDKDATYKLWCSLVTPKFEAVLKQFY